MAGELKVVTPDYPIAAADPGPEPRADTPEMSPDMAAPDALRHALTVLEIESTALRLLIAALANGGAEPLERAVEAIARCTGRLVVTGIGKSGLIGRKIAATFASTGTPAYYVHPAEASHGDLGMITCGDVVLALSNSGETPELGDLLSYTRRQGIALVAITGRIGSTLARHADILLLLPNAPEACPLGLAPTTSTTLMLALGDALAVALMQRRRFTRHDFWIRHPGGKLGRSLARVEDLIRGPRSLPTVHLDAPVSEVILTMVRTGYGCAGVIDDHGHLIGVITETDMRRNMGPEFLSLRAGEIMSDTALSVQPDMPAREALHKMTALNVSNLFVTEGPRPIGILHIEDCRRVEAA